MAIWTFERGVRFGRILYCNLHVLSSRGSVLCRTRSAVWYDENAELLRIRVVVAKTFMNPGPGQHFFLYQPFRLTGWESHPFTLAYWDQSVETRVESTGDNIEDSDKSAEMAAGSRPPPRSTDKTQAVDVELDASKKTYEFWVRPRDGWTKSLRDNCRRIEGSQVSPLLLIEGPYGHAMPLWRYDMVLLIAGGSGIAAMVPYILDHIRRATHQVARSRQVDLVWASRSEGYLRSITSGVLADALLRSDISACFHVTKSHSVSSAFGKIQENGNANEKPGESIVGGNGGSRQSSMDAPSQRTQSIACGRPDLEAYIHAAATKARESSSSLAVMACGPATLTDTSRAVVKCILRDNTQEVEYFEEVFGW